MKTRKNDLIQGIILVVLALSVLLSLLIPQLFRSEAPPQRLSLSVLLRDEDSAGWSTARQGMEQAADELGAELRFLTLASSGNSAEQAESLRREVEEGADALVVVPADPLSLTQTLDQLPGHCPMVSLESPVGSFSGVAAPDNDLLGRQLAQALFLDWDGGAVLLWDSSPASTGVSARLMAARETLEGLGVPTETVSALPQEDISHRWVMAFEPSATRQAADRNSRQELPFSLYGVGTSTAIIIHLEKGVISALAAWNDYAAGYLAVRQAVSAAQGEKGDLEPLPFSILRGEDIYEPENQKLLFPVTS